MKGLEPMRVVRPPLRYRLGEFTFAIWKPQLLYQDCEGLARKDFDFLLRNLDLPGDCDGVFAAGLSCQDIHPGVFRGDEWLWYVRGIERLYYVEIHGDVESYYQRFSAKHRKNLRRVIRSFVGDGQEVHFSVAKRPDEMAEFHRIAVEISRQTYQSALLQAGMPAGKEAEGRMRELAAEDCARGYLLRMGGTPVAFAWCRGKGERLTYDVIGFLPQYAKYSPGTALLCLILEDLFREKRFRMLDFGPGGGWYKESFSTGFLEYVDALVFRRSLKNLFLAGVHYCLERINTIAGVALERAGLKKKVKRFMRRILGA